MVLLSVQFIFGLAILLFATEKFVLLAERIAKVLRISPLIIGITIVAIGTSIPELAVSVISIIKQDADLALGNIIGSNITNVLLILPVGILIGNMRIGRIKTQHSALFLLGSTALFFLTQFMPLPKFVLGILLIGVAAGFSIFEYKLGVEGREHEDNLQKISTPSGSISLAQIIIGMFLLSLIIVGGLLIVESVEAIARISGISTSILGLTLTAIATSLPELLTTIYSQNNNQEKITVGNILGSNVYNLLLVGGVLMLFPAVLVVNQKEWIWLGATTIGFILFLKWYSGKQPGKLIGVLLLATFLAYLGLQ
jgi:cation:H+ antiporter